MFTKRPHFPTLCSYATARAGLLAVLAVVLARVERRHILLIRHCNAARAAARGGGGGEKGGRLAFFETPPRSRGGEGRKRWLVPRVKGGGGQMTTHKQ